MRTRLRGFTARADLRCFAPPEFPRRTACDVLQAAPRWIRRTSSAFVSQTYTQHDSLCLGLANVSAMRFRGS